MNLEQEERRSNGFAFAAENRADCWNNIDEFYRVYTWCGGGSGGSLGSLCMISKIFVKLLIVSRFSCKLHVKLDCHWDFIFKILFVVVRFFDFENTISTILQRNKACLCRTKYSRSNFDFIVFLMMWCDLSYLEDSITCKLVELSFVSYGCCSKSMKTKPSHVVAAATVINRWGDWRQVRQ